MSQTMITKTSFLILLITVCLCGYSVAGLYSCPPNGLDSKHGNLGAKYWANKTFDLAEKETRTAIKYNPNCSMWHQNLGFILDSQGRKEESIQSLLKSIEVDKDWCSSFKTGSHMKLGMLYCETRNYKKSIDAFLNAVRLGKIEEADDATMSQIYLHLSYNYTEPNGDAVQFYNLKSAEELTKKAFDLTPGKLPIKFSFAKIYALAGDVDKAQAELAAIILQQEKSMRPSPYAYAYTAFIYSIMKNPKKSAEYMGKALDLNPHYSKYLLDELDKDFVNVSSSDEMAPVIAKARDLAK